MTRVPDTVLAFALLAALPLGACVAVPDEAEAPAQAVTESTVTPEGEPTATAANAPTPGVPRAPIVPLAQFTGLSSGQVTGMLGTPQFLRQDASTELWQYRGDGCVLHLFLYRDKDGLRVRHAEVRPRTMPGVTMNGAAAEACLTKLSAAPPAATS